MIQPGEFLLKTKGEINMPGENLFNVPFELLALGAAVETGIIDTLEKKTVTATELAAKLKSDARAVWVVVEALAALGYLSKQDQAYTLSEKARNMFYNTTAPDYSGFAFMHRYNLIKSWVNLPGVIATGQPHPRERGREDTRYFMDSMRQGARRSAPAMAEFLLAGAGEGVRVLDIGGGPLTYAAAFAGYKARVTVLDLPEVVERMQGEALARGIEMVPGDFNLGLPPGPFDLAYLGNICHIFGEQENRELFKKVRDALAPGGRIAIVDFIRGTTPMAAIFGINMLVNTRSGGTWTLEQYQQWLEAAGFIETQLNIVGERQLITAVRK